MDYDDLRGPRGDMPPFHTTSPINGDPVVRVTIAVPSRNAAMNLRRYGGCSLMVELMMRAIGELSSHGVLPKKTRYVQIDIPEGAIEEACEP